MTTHVLRNVLVVSLLGILGAGSALSAPGNIHGGGVPGAVNAGGGYVTGGPHEANYNAMGLILQLPDAPAGEGYRLHQDVGPTHSFPFTLARGAAQPFFNSWDQLTEDQKASLRTHYQNLSPTDEPPYPTGGLNAVYKPISDLVNKTGNAMLGAATLGVVVGRDGRVEGINAYAQKAPAVATVMAQLLQDVRFKPGLCDGEPCRMEFPVAYTVAGWP